jgi:formylglycine-generating enzyme required for sulfatase activity
LVCGVELEAMPEVAVKYVISETEMTLAESMTLVPITGGTVTKEPDHTYQGGDSSMGFPREPGPFAETNLPITVPSFMMGKYEVSNKLWYEVAKWSEERADENLKYNYGGHSETAIDPTGTPKEFFPRVFVSQEEAWLWCNAFTEYWNEKIKDADEAEKTPYIVNNLTDKIPIRTKTEMVQALNAHVVQDPSATGFRLPSPAEWEYAARGGIVDGPQWDWNWPGTNVFSEVKDYAWVDSLRIYDTYQNEIRIGMLLPNAAGLHDMGGNVHEWTTKPDSLDPSQTITRGGAFNRNEDRSGFDESRQELKPASSRDIIGFRVICAIPE